jgi:GTP pyrophosphokinase
MVGPQAVISRLISIEGGEDAVADETSEDRVITRRQRSTGSAPDSGIHVLGASDLWVKLAKCCTPVPGDEILGFVTRGSGVSVHRTDCANTQNLQTQPERVIGVEWGAPTAQSAFLVNIQVEALDRNRLLSDITRALSDQHVNILSAALTTSRDRICRARFTFETADPTHLDHVLRGVRGVPGVFDVYRIKQ